MNKKMQLLKTPDFSKTTVLFGGSFDPIHNGHLHVAKYCSLQMPTIEQFVFVPCFISPWKTETQAPAAERLRFMLIALENTPYFIWDFELKNEKPSFTIFTLEEAQRLGATKNKLYWILGADAYNGLATWRSAGRFRSLCKFIIVTRPEVPLLKQHEEDSILTIPPNPCSSTSIRHALAQGKIPKNCLPQKLNELFTELSLKSCNPYAMQSTT